MLAPSWVLFYQGEPESTGEFSSSFAAEAERPSSEFFKLLRIQFPEVVETLTFLPTSTTLDDGNTVAIGAATKHEAIDDPVDSPDDDTSYVRNDSADTATEDRYGFDSLPDDVVSILEVRVFARGATGFEAGDVENDGPWSYATRVNGVNYFEDQDSPNRFFNLAHKTQVLKFANSPDTLVPWTIAEFDAIEVSSFTQPDGAGSLFGQRHTQTYIQVDVSRTRRGQYSDSPVNSRSEGVYLNRVIDWGEIRYSAEGYDIERVSTRVRVADHDNELGALFSGKDGERARGAVTDLRYASTAIADKTQWFTAFSGRLTSWDEVEPRIYDLFFRTEDDGFDSEVPRRKYTEFDFPNAEPKIFSFFMQILYGVHDVEGLSSDGSVLCLDVDRVRFRRHVSQAIMTSVIRVYSKAGNDDPVVLRTVGYGSGTAVTAGYRVITPIVNGTQHTIIEFNVTGAGEAELFEELEITADVEGIEEVGDGTGILVRNADAFVHFVTNFVKGNYQSGAWLPDDPIINTESWDLVQEFLNDLGQDTSRRIGGTSQKRKAEDEMADWLFQLRVKGFWEPDGSLAGRPMSPFTLTVYKDDPWIREGLHDIEEPSYEVDDTGIKQRVFVNYIQRSASKDYLANIEVRDFELDGDEAETVEATWSRAALPEAT